MNADLKLKVCGMRDPENILEVANIAPDFMGFIFYDRSPRYVGDNFKMPEFSEVTKKVGVFVNESTDVMIDTSNKFCLDFLQLHGHESVDQCRELKRAGVGIIKVFSMDNQTDLDLTLPFASVADYFLFDTRGKYYGGNSTTFDWGILNQYHGEVPFFLSGGITPEHIDEVKQIGHSQLWAIDVNSGVEIRPAFKDVEKVKAIRTTLNSK